MNDAMNKVWEFHKACGVYCQQEFGLPEQKIRQLRMDLLKEECWEYFEAETANDPVAVADALADMIYIICGTAHAYGIPLAQVFAEVHRSNMLKVDPATGKAARRADGKILKPEGWEPPQIEAVCRAGVIRG